MQLLPLQLNLTNTVIISFAFLNLSLGLLACTLSQNFDDPMMSQHL